jgi:hypothetical protein
MSPTLQRGDFFMANLWRYRSHAPAIDEIVVYPKPSAPGVEFIKRVVGIPGSRLRNHIFILAKRGVTTPGISHSRLFPKALSSFLETTGTAALIAERKVQ